MADSHLWATRATAGRASVIIAESHDRETARDMTFGLLAGFLMVCARYEDWDRVLMFVNQLAIESRVPVPAEKPKLKLVGEA